MKYFKRNVLLKNIYPIGINIDVPKDSGYLDSDVFVTKTPYGGFEGKHIRNVIKIMKSDTPNCVLYRGGENRWYRGSEWLYNKMTYFIIDGDNINESNQQGIILSTKVRYIDGVSYIELELSNSNSFIKNTFCKEPSGMILETFIEEGANVGTRFPCVTSNNFHSTGKSSLQLFENMEEIFILESLKKQKVVGMEYSIEFEYSHQCDESELEISLENFKRKNCHQNIETITIKNSIHQWKTFKKTVKITNQNFVNNPEECIYTLALCLKCSKGHVFIDNLKVENLTNKVENSILSKTSLKIIEDLNFGHIRWLSYSSGQPFSNMILENNERKHYLFSSSASYVNEDVDKHKNIQYSWFNLQEMLLESLTLKNKNVWLILPGALYYDEMNEIVEYLSGDDTTKFGKKRIEQGFKTPWSDCFDHIIFEFGNELWDYWDDNYKSGQYVNTLIKTAQENKFYKNNLKFIPSVNAFGNKWEIEEIEKNYYNSNECCLNCYTYFNPNATDIKNLSLTNKINRMFSFYHRRYKDNKGICENLQKQIYIYEFNNSGLFANSDEYCPPELFDTYVNSVVGGLNLAQNCLNNFKLLKANIQSFFNLLQYHRPQFGEEVRLYGLFDLNLMTLEKTPRQSYYILKLINNNLYKNLIEVDLEINNNTIIKKDYDFEQIQSFCFNEDNKYSLFVLNLSENSFTLPLPKKEYKIITYSSKEVLESENIITEKTDIVEKYYVPHYSMSILKWEDLLPVEKFKRLI